MSTLGRLLGTAAGCGTKSRRSQLKGPLTALWGCFNGAGTTDPKPKPEEEFAVDSPGETGEERVAALGRVITEAVDVRRLSDKVSTPPAFGPKMSS